MQLMVLGPLEVREGEALLTVRRGRPRSLLHLLLVHRRAVLPAEVVADRLWQDEPPVDGVNAVQQVVSYLRRALGPAGRTVLATRPTGYALEVGDTEVDAWRFERLVHEAMSGAGEGTAAAAERTLGRADAAIGLWRGEPFTESAGFDWVAGDVARLQDTYLQAHESRLEAMLTLGRHREVALEAQSLATAYPLREQLHGHLALALYRSGRQGEALEAHRRARGVLAEELGIDPGPRLQRLEQDILRQDPGLDWRAPADRVDVTPPAPPATPVDVAAAPEPLPPRPPDAPVIRLVGREHDLATAGGALAEGRLLTLTGPGGVGKTRLATELAREHPGPVWWVSLEEVESDEHVAGTVADRLGLAGRLPHDPTDRVATALARRPGLLVLDGCEQVAGGAAALVARLLPDAPGLSVLATSRRPVSVDGERVHQLGPLPVPGLPSVPGPGAASADGAADNPSVVLFAERARLVRADFALDEHNLADVAGIVADLDGLPLAIELAAAHVDVAGPASVRARIAGRIDALEPGPATGPGGRRRSLRAAIDTSLQLCSDTERRLFAELGVFPGGFDLAAVEAVTGASSAEVYDGVSALVRQSLLVRDGERGYRMLAPLRAQAVRRQAEGSTYDELRRRHAAWVAAAAAGAGGSGPDRASGMDQAIVGLGRLLPDARSALTWSLDAGELDLAAEVTVGFAWLWALHGLAEEGITWLQQVKDRCDAAEPVPLPGSRRMRATVLRSLGLLANPVGRLELAREVCEESVALYDEAGDRMGAAAALMTLGVSQWALGRLDEAAASHDRAVELTGGEPGSWQYVASLVLRARTALDAGEPDASLRIDRAVELAQQGDQEQMLGLALALRARHLLLLGDLASAALTAEAAREVWRTIDYREGEMAALNLLGRVRLRGGQVDAAVGCFRRALAVARLTHHRGAACESLESLAMAAAATGRREHAFLLLCVAARERARIAAPVPGGDRAALEQLERQLRSGLGDAVAPIETRAGLQRFDHVADQLVGDLGGTGALGG